MQRKGFTLIEILTVIAIIAILAAIAFPVISKSKETAYRASDSTHMNEIRNAMQLYRTDQGGFPPALLGYVTLYTSGPETGQVIPANQLKGFLFPKRIDALAVMQPSYYKYRTRDITTAVWPNIDNRALGSAPIVDLDHDGALENGDDDLACARQAFDGAETVKVNPSVNTSPDAEFYRLSGYDVAHVPTTGGGNIDEVHYALFWTSWGLGVNGCSRGNGFDDPRQLGYFDPPETTLITWNSNFRDYNGDVNGVPARSKHDIAIFLGGAAKPFDSRNLYERSWRVLPR